MAEAVKKQPTIGEIVARGAATTPDEAAKAFKDGLANFLADEERDTACQLAVIQIGQRANAEGWPDERRDEETKAIMRRYYGDGVGI